MLAQAALAIGNKVRSRQPGQVGIDPAQRRPFSWSKAAFFAGAAAVLGTAATCDTPGSVTVDAGRVTIERTYGLHNQCYAGYDARVEGVFARRTFYIYTSPITPDIPGDFNSELNVMERQQACTTAKQIKIQKTTENGVATYDIKVPLSSMILQQWEPDTRQLPKHNGSAVAKAADAGADVLGILPGLEELVPESQGTQWGVTDAIVKTQARISAASCQDMAWNKGGMKKKFEKAFAEDFAATVGGATGTKIDPETVKVSTPTNIKMPVEATKIMKEIAGDLKKYDIDLDLKKIKVPTCKVIDAQQKPAGSR